MCMCLAENVLRASLTGDEIVTFPSVKALDTLDMTGTRRCVVLSLHGDSDLNVQFTDGTKGKVSMHLCAFADEIDEELKDLNADGDGDDDDDGDDDFEDDDEFDDDE